MKFAILGVLLASAALSPAADVNLAREPGARAIGSGSNGPFVISKLNDGRTDSMGMWSSDGHDGAFCGVRLGDQPVNFNTVRFHLFNGRAAFSGWRLEGADDVEIDDDPDPGVCPGTAAVYDPEPILGKAITGSIRPESGAKFAAGGAGDWFLTQQIPQWISVDFGAETEFNYFAIASAQVVHFRLQTSNDGTAWKDLIEVDRVRPPYQWNGYFEKTRARHLRLVVLKPSWDVHVKRLLVANLAQPPADQAGKPAAARKAAAGTLPELPKFPEAAPRGPGA